MSWWRGSAGLRKCLLFLLLKLEEIGIFSGHRPICVFVQCPSCTDIKAVREREESNLKRRAGPKTQY